MWKIRREQMALLGQATDKRYYEELRVLLREQFPQLVSRFDDHMLADKVSAAVQAARSLRIQTGRGILAYVGLSIAAGSSFNNDPKIKHFFDVPGRNPDGKIEWLFSRVQEKLQILSARPAPGPDIPFLKPEHHG